MILIESVDKKQKQITIKTTADLMCADQSVAVVDIEINQFGIFIKQLTELQDLLPYQVRNNKIGLAGWLYNRGLIRKNHRNIFFTELVLNLESRELFVPTILSLSTNAVSISDKYWLNPKETISFIINGAKIVFERKTWDAVNPFVNLYLPGQLEEYGLCDCFFIQKPENLNPRSLIWSIDGAQNKRWMVDENGYYLEKKLDKAQFENELATLEFFLLNGVLVPEYTYYIKELNDPDKEYDRIYSLDTIYEGLHVIQKRCLTGADSYLEKLIDYVDNDSVIEEPIKRMFALHNVSETETDYFIKTIKEYQAKFDVRDSLLDTRNMGLLIENNKATPVVWGRLKRRVIWNGQIE